RVARANLTAFIATVRREYGADVADYPSLYRWSITSPERFWPAVWRFCGVIAAERDGGAEPWDEVGVGLDRMAPPDPVRGPSWFPGARLNFAENLLRRRDAHPALVAWNESGTRRELSYRALHAATARVASPTSPGGSRRSSRWWSFRTSRSGPRSTRSGALCCGTSGWGRRRGRLRSNSSGSRSTIRSTSSIRRARRDSRSAWCTAPGARCCSTKRSTCCTSI